MLTAALIVLALTVMLWAGARHLHVQRLLARARRPAIQPAARAARMTSAAAGGPSSVPSFPAGGDPAAVALTGAVLWEVARIDPSVVEGLSAASGVENGPPAVPATVLGLVERVSAHGGAPDSAAFTSRLAVHIGECRAGAVLEAQRHLAQWATTPDDPNWDLLVDGIAADVKTRTSSAAVTPGALPHLDDVHLLPGFSPAAVDCHVDEAADAAGHLLEVGGAVADVALLGPLVRVVRAGWHEGVEVVRYGKPPRDAIVDGALDVGVRAGSIVVSAKAGALLGAGVDAAAAGGTAGAGAVVGGIVGAVAGSRAGGAAHERIRTSMGEGLRARLIGSVEAYGAELLAGGFSAHVEERVLAPVGRSRTAVLELERLVADDRRGLRRMLWPGMDHVLREEALRQGQRDVLQREQVAGAAVSAWRAVLERDDAARLIGLAAIAAPERPEASARESQLRRSVVADRRRLATSRSGEWRPGPAGG